MMRRVFPNTSRTRTAAAALLVAGALLSRAACAQLGGDQASVYNDAQVFGAMVTSHPGLGYVRYDIRTERTTIHEFAGLSGQVFAVTFGGSKPNLPQLLGSYLDAYAASVTHASADHRHASVTTSTLKAELHGRPNALVGRIWLPTLTPANVDLEKLQ